MWGHAVSIFLLGLMPCVFGDSLPKGQKAHLTIFYDYTLMEAFISETFTNGHFISKFRHTHSLKNIVEQISQEDFELLLQMSSNALNSLKDSLKTIEFKEVLEKQKEVAESEKAALVKDMETKYTRQIEELKAVLTVSEAGQHKLKEQFADITSKAELVFKNSLTEFISQKDSQFQKELARLQEHHREEIKERLAQSESHYKETISSMKTTYTELEAKLRAAHEKSFISSEKGKQGEKEFEELCAEHTSWGTLVNTSKEDSATDRRCVIRGCSTMFEIKNYQSTIPSTEINKFLRDMKEHRESPLGVFVSLHTNISKKQGNYIQIEWTQDSQLLVYISSFYTHSVPDTLSFIDSCATIALTVYKSAAAAAAAGNQDSEVSIGLQSRIELAKHSISSEVKGVTDCMQSLTQNKKDIVSLIDKQYIEHQSKLNKMKTGLTDILHILLGKHEDPVIPPQTPVEKSKKRAKRTGTAAAASGDGAILH